jgi:predicted dehydrogenase
MINWGIIGAGGIAFRLTISDSLSKNILEIYGSKGSILWSLLQISKGTENN